MEWKSSRAYQLEVCPVCQYPITVSMENHLLSTHKGIVRIGDIFWLNKTEAIYSGRRYMKKERSYPAPIHRARELV